MEGDQDQDEFDSQLKKWFEGQLFSFQRSDLLTRLTSRERVDTCWQMLKKKVLEQLAVFDSNNHCESVKPDRII
jgi:hypothetical protein